MLQVGDQAPVFEAESTKGKVALQNHLGKQPIVLIFYPQDETPLCTKQLCAVRDSSKQYEAANALVLGINPGSLEHHKRFAMKNNYDFPLVTDTDSRIKDSYDVKKGILGIIGQPQQRVVYVIGKSGRIIYARKGNRPTEEILAAIGSAE
ncbi:peroxiredoxin [Paenibacillus sepulcri]|uniref:thioredoxin-dependent peroxiredoxin n=1 Tax=Paenibacillus sepulcri TaxID=359917 RepID=A0ABS7C364_9BACL|nr:peroxiredoxin [Paenibacillus sepulcri]